MYTNLCTVSRVGRLRGLPRWTPTARHSTSPATAAEVLKNNKNWRVVSSGPIRELNLDSALLEHNVTKTRYLHLGCDDSNNAFSINFRTTPMDSTGVAHILEHTTLCGSQKFPTRDPFMKMLTRSLSTFMNAMTGPDYTMYPFSTCNHQDFENLMNVYLDSVLRPLLKEEDFLQEGWRLENEDILDADSKLVVKGVVFNEMKGAYSDSQGLFGQHLLNNLLPGHTYAHSSGGYPLDIPDLSWEACKEFHAKHYHPSNARIYTYGDIPLEKHLKTLDSYLSRYSFLEMDTLVPSEKRWTTPRRREIKCAPDPMNTNPDKQTTVAVSYLMKDITHIQESLIVQVVGELLMGGASSPLYKALIQSGIGSDFSPVSGCDSTIKETSFTVGLQNVAVADVELVLKSIDKTIDEAIAEGFSEERVQAAIHSFDLAQKHREGNFGIKLIMSMTPYWNHSDTPIEFLRVRYSKNLADVKEQMRMDPTFMQKKVKEYFRDNTHKLVQVMTPTETFIEEEQKKFDGLEEKLRSNLTPADIKNIQQKNLSLRESQNMIVDASCLPTLRVEDIPDEYVGAEVRHLTLAGGLPTQITLQPCNSVSYFRALIDTSAVPSELKPYLPLFAAFLSKLGAKEMSYQDLDTKIELSTGGLHASCHVYESPYDLNSITEGILLSSYCLDYNIEQMMGLWSAIFNDLHLRDVGRLNTLVSMSATFGSNGIAEAGHRFAMSSAASAINARAAILESQGGMEHVNHVARLSTQDGHGLLEKLRALAARVLNRNCINIALNSMPSTEQRLISGTQNFLAEVPGSWSPANSIPRDFQSCEAKTHHVVPFPINFTAQAFPTVPFTHPDAAKLKVLAVLLTSKFLHQEIREKGGAYGGGASAGSGTFNFYSYRDPKNLETFTCYRRAVEWASSGSYEDQYVEEAKLGVFQQLDNPDQPGYRGLRYFLSGIDDNTFKEHRIRVKQVTKADLIEVSDRYLLDAPLTGRTLIGPAQTGLEDLGWDTRRFHV